MNRLKFIVTTTGPLPPTVGPSPPTVCTYIQLHTCSILDCYRCMHACMCWVLDVDLYELDIHIIIMWL